MKFKNVCFVLLMLQLCLIFGQNAHAQNIIVIDPGHGGIDAGAVGINGVKEKVVVLNIAKEILNLKKTIFDEKLDIYLTRYSDTLISLADRSRLAKSLQADLFISLHCNASNTSSKGMEVYVHTSNNSTTKKSIALGLSILNENTKKLGFKKRGVKFGNFQVLRETTDFCPAILVEMGFVTNPDEADYYLKDSNIRGMALAVLMGIINSLNIAL